MISPLYGMNNNKMQTRTGRLHLDHACHQVITCCMIITSLLCLLSCHRDLVRKAYSIHHIVYTLQGIILANDGGHIEMFNVFIQRSFKFDLPRLISRALSTETVHQWELLRPTGPHPGHDRLHWALTAELMNKSRNICARLLAKISNDGPRDLLHKMHDAKTFG